MTVAVPPAPLFADPLPAQAAPEVLAFLARRRSSSALLLREPGPGAAELGDLIRLAARVPDHGKLGPWRFIILEGEGKVAYARRLEEIAQGRPDSGKCLTKLSKLKTPPVAVAVVSHITPGEIPEWEQLLSAGAVCHQLLLAASAMGYGANWITDWYAYDERAREALGLNPSERLAGFIFIGTNTEPPQERVRPDLTARVSRYQP